MWKIKDVKYEGKKYFKRNIWTYILIGLFMSIIVGEYVTSNNSFDNLQIIQNFFMDNKNENVVESSNDLINYGIIYGKNIINKQINSEDWLLQKQIIGKERIQKNEYVIINKYVDQGIARLLLGNATDNIKEYNEKNNVTKGVFFSIFNILTRSQSQLQNMVNSISNYVDKEIVERLIVMIVAIVAFLIKILFTNPLLVGESRIYLESINYRKTKIKRLTYCFKRGRYFSSVRSIFLMKLFKILWNVTIIGGIIKRYSYKMVTFIVAENPKIKARDAIKMSREMMNGSKLNAFKLDLTFFFWWLLECLTFGIAGLYVTPYYKSVCTQLYVTLRKDYILNKKYNYEMLNDELLFNKSLAKEKYPELIDENGKIEKYPELTKKRIKIDYNKKYELTSIILFFFIFAFAGWIWEVGMFIFKYGIFINRGMMYGPWLPIYGTGCTLIILLTKLKKFRKLLKKPFLTFLVIMILCTIIEYFTSYVTEIIHGTRYWDYTGIFMNLNGRVCLEGAIFFGLGGSMCIYFVAPFLENLIQKITKEKKVAICTALVTLFLIDQVFTMAYPRTGLGITEEIEENQLN